MRLRFCSRICLPYTRAVRTADGWPGNRAPLMISERKSMPTWMLAIPQRMPLGQVKIKETKHVTMRPLRRWSEDTINDRTHRVPYHQGSRISPL